MKFRYSMSEIILSKMLKSSHLQKCGRYEVGEIFNVYTANDRKFGCEWDGISLATSIEKLEAVLIKDNLI